MKEATGELNMTVITVVAIVAVGALFTWFLFPMIRSNIAIRTACSTLDSTGASNNTSSDADEGVVSCKEWKCEVTYGGKKYTGSCEEKAK